MEIIRGSPLIAAGISFHLVFGRNPCAKSRDSISAMHLIPSTTEFYNKCEDDNGNYQQNEKEKQVYGDFNLCKTSPR